jgi:hypothetical protein
MRAYDSYAEQKHDQRIGFVAFPIVNIILWIVTALISGKINPFDRSADAYGMRSMVVWLPWAVNGLIMVAALILRRHIAFGYLISLVGFAIVFVGLGLISVVAYFVSAPLQALFDLGGFLFFLLLILVVGSWFLFKMFGVLRRWWAV